MFESIMAMLSGALGGGGTAPTTSSAPVNTAPSDAANAAARAATESPAVILGMFKQLNDAMENSAFGQAVKAADDKMQAVDAKLTASMPTGLDKVLKTQIGGAQPKQDAQSKVVYDQLMKNVAKPLGLSSLRLF